MSRHAIVIGIDSYSNRDWNLSSSVIDALRFAEWVTGAGGVPRENLRLLLSPKRKRPNTIVPYLPADSRTIRRAIRDFSTCKAGAGAERLYVYFGGHGLTAPGVTDEPVLVPADVQEIELDEPLLVGFSQLITVLSRAEPEEQLFFLDACRDFGLENFAPPLGRAVGPWSPRDDERARSRQFVLYATSLGERAYEQEALGSGIFTGALLEVLAGKHPVAAPWISAKRSYEVSFSSLAEQVKRMVKERMARTPTAERYVQQPEPLFMRGSDTVLSDFKTLPKVRVQVRIGPRAARKDCRLRLLTYPPGNAKGRPLGKWRGPPLKPTTPLTITPGDYGLQAQARGYQTYDEQFSAFSPRNLTVELLETDEEPAPETESGSLVVISKDPTAVIVVRDGERAVVKTGHGRVTIRDLEPALYRLQLVTVEGDTIEEDIVLKAGPETTVSLAAPGHEIGREQVRMLAKHGIRADKEGYLHPSEQLGGIGDARLASLLGFAAYAAQRPDDPDFDRLRQLGVRSLGDVPAGSAGLLLIVGASGKRPARDVPRRRFLAEGEFVVRDLEGQPLGLGEFELLPGLPTAGQADLQLKPGCLTVELRLPGLAPTRYALTTLSDRVTVLIAVAEDDGDVEVQQYLLPLRPGDDYLTEAPENIRRLEVAQRYYANQRDVPDERALDDLLSGKFLDPLLGALAGYVFVQAGRADDYRKRALGNMLERFPGLPDSHVLAALCEPKQRDAHFDAALQLGLPVFADGFRALYAWYAEKPRDTKRPIWVQPSLLLPGSPWTAWVASRPVLRIRDGVFERAPVGWDIIERNRAAIEGTARSVGKLVPKDGSLPLVATAFVVAPDVVMTMSIALEGRAPSDFLVDFGDGKESERRPFEVEELLGVGGAGRPTELVALLRLADSSGESGPSPPPLTLAGSVPDRPEGRPVYALGFPGSDARAPKDIQRLFTGQLGSKYLQPGQLISVTDTKVHHDCLTLGGSGGSPVVDAETGFVLGMHYAGLWLDFKRGEAVALWTVKDVPPLTEAAIGFEGDAR